MPTTRLSARSPATQVNDPHNFASLMPGDLVLITSTSYDIYLIAHHPDNTETMILVNLHSGTIRTNPKTKPQLVTYLTNLSHHPDLKVSMFQGTVQLRT